MDIKDEFRRVLDDFKAKAKLTNEELKDFQFSGFDDVQATLSLIQQEQTKKKMLVYMRRIEPFLKTMTEYGKVIQIFVNTSEILAFVWGPMRFLIMVASNFVDAFNALLDMYQDMGEQIPLLHSYTTLFSENSHMRQLLVMIYEDILRVHIIALRYFRQKIWRSLFQSSWKGLALEINLIKENLRRHRQLIESRASLVQFESVQNLRTQAEASFQEVKISEDRRRKTFVLQWLSAPDAQAAHERYLKARAWNTKSCNWILADTCYRGWADPLYCSTPLLWINGKPGAGKSVLASIIIDHVKEIDDVSMGFFYFAHGNPERGTFVAMARAILSQLFVQDASLLLHFEKVATSSGQAVLSSRGLAKELLAIALKSRKTYIILDGIDECERDDRKEICSWFRTFADSLPTSSQDEVRCLFVCQDDGFARKDLSTVPILNINEEHTRGDIAEYAQYWQDKIEQRFGPLQIEFPLAKLVTERSQGMFIFAKCVLTELHQQPSRAHLLREWGAEKFPRKLQDVYARILRRVLNSQIVPHQRDITKKLLSWISVAKRPLRWYEIQGAISIDLENEIINESDRRLIDDSKDLCASFVEVHADQTVEFVHDTVRKFLRDSVGVVVPAKVELELCLLSMAYLNFPAIYKPGENGLMSGQFAFYDYAVANWNQHFMAWLSENSPGHDKSDTLDVMETSHDESDLLNVKESFESFLDQHFSDRCPTNHVSQRMHDKLRRVHSFDFYESLAQAIVWSRKQLLVTDSPTKGEHVVTQLDFPLITRKIRSVLEDRVQRGLTPETRATLEMYYGTKWFRCPRIYCRHFYDGFESQDNRDRHVDRHVRGYMCTFDGCPMTTIGCVSVKDLDKHLFEAHGIGGPNDQFPTIQESNARPASQRRSASPDSNAETPRKRGPKKRSDPYMCEICGKRFTRGHNLKAHVRTHSDVRPFSCSVCGKAFTRWHDRETHERTHSGEKPFSCKGLLKAGGQWGCGRSYTRKAALARHFNCDAGRRCLEPLRIEEAKEREQALEAGQHGQLQEMEDEQQLGNDLPAALLAQYPDFAYLDLSQEIDMDG